MNESEKELVKRLGSGDKPEEVRFPAWDLLFGVMSDKQHRFFEYGNQWLPGTHNPQDAHDLALKLYCRIRNRLAKGPLVGDNPEGYIWRTAENILCDYLRKQRKVKEIPLEEFDDLRERGSLSPEEELDLKETARRAQDLCLRLPDQKDRLLMLLA